MRGWWPIFKRELLSYYVTPLAWIVMTSFLVLQGMHFYVLVAQLAAQGSQGADAGPVQSFFGGTVLLYLPLLFVCPVLTMRLFAEERRSGTIEALLTTPVHVVGVVLGKYLAVLVAYVVMWLPTVLYMALVARHGDVQWPVVGAGYLGMFAIGAGFLAVGTMTSALTNSQLAAAITSAMAIIGLFMLGIGAFILPDGPGRELCAYLSVWGQMNDFSRGIIDTRRLVLDATLVVVPLFITVRAVESWRSP